MRIPLLAMAVASFAAAPGGPAVAQTQVERLREACLTTSMQHEAFERLFSTRNLTSLIPVVRQGEESKLADWASGYDDGGIQIVMSGSPADPSNATDCGVLAPRPVGDWRAEIEALARELNMRPAPPEDLPNVVEARSWTTNADRRLTLHYEVYRQGVVVRFALPATSSQ